MRYCAAVLLGAVLGVAVMAAGAFLAIELVDVDTTF